MIKIVDKQLEGKKEKWTNSQILPDWCFYRENILKAVLKEYSILKGDVDSIFCCSFLHSLLNAEQMDFIQHEKHLAISTLQPKTEYT